MLIARGVGILRSDRKASARHDAVFVSILKFDALNEVAVGIFENDQLVCDDAVDYFLFLPLGDVVERCGFVQLIYATAVSLSSVEHLVYVGLLAAAGVLVARSEGSKKIHFDLWRDLVLLTNTHLSDRVELLAAIALDQMEVRPYLPIDLFPRNTVGLPDESYEFFQIPVAVNYVFCPHLAIAVDEIRALAACEYLSLLLRK